ncbi:CobW family GTP-binding protein [Marinifilum caeruleilacunae]|uniref:GTP-binding protein n=1 Tax=Marinifilum caeruleilacunae TaxID=2499076 RepID=A0ABX1X1F1_9BACT|nr:GTP-binding protein [Marinifilum caeruleilacunae]NOU61910.1 GTP-binding protein [Marinifilum caeruleilacunae]
MNKIPVTVITGFLGAGKTSLLNHFIADYKEKKFAIIENEFGEENIDSSLVENIQSEDIFELSNGCICCNLNQELFVVLQKLIESKHDFNHLLIETTGIADPGSILASFISDPLIKNQFVLDSVICLTDAHSLSSDLQKEEVLSKQIAIADVILLNKLDLVSASEADQNIQLLKEHNSHAEIVRCQYSKVEEIQLLDRFSYQPDKVFQHILGLESSKINHSENIHGIQSMLFTCEDPLDQMKIGMWLDAFLQFNQDTIYRVKGILNLAGVDNKIILQSVHTQIQATVGKAWEQDEKRESKIVIIGKSLNREVIDKNLLELKA